MSARWPETCWNCGTPISQNHAGRPKEICDHPLCFAVRLYWRRHGRRPAPEFFLPWAWRMGLIKLPRRLAAMACPQQPDLLEVAYVA